MGVLAVCKGSIIENVLFKKKIIVTSLSLCCQFHSDPCTDEGDPSSRWFSGVISFHQNHVRARERE